MTGCLAAFEQVLKAVVKTDADFFQFLILETFTSRYTAW